MLVTSRVATFQGEIRPPSDKSLTHRAFMIAACASGPSVVSSPLLGHDCLATLRCLEAMGLRSEKRGDDSFVLTPCDDPEWVQPAAPLDCGNSGTTMRLLSGLIASRPLCVELFGDASLSKRPMKRIVEPLRSMGAEIVGDTPPLKIAGSRALRGIDYQSPVASAQIKSCVLLAGMRAVGTTSVVEPSQSRDHTERMLRACGVDVRVNGLRSSVEGGGRPTGFEFDVPGDISSAAFWMVAAATLPGAHIRLRDVGVNPTRTGILDVFERARIPHFVDDLRESMGEPIGTIEVSDAQIGQPIEIGGDLVPRLIDEIPILAVLATQLDGISRFRDLEELRLKESDRLALMASGLRAMGADVVERENGFDIGGPTKLRGAKIDANHDHRIAMAFAIAGLLAEGRTEIAGAETIATSYPDFERDLWSVCVV